MLQHLKYSCHVCHTIMSWHRKCKGASSQRSFQGCLPVLGVYLLSTLEWRRRARARATSCFWPAERGAPPSDSTRSRPSGVASTISDKCARRSAAQHSASLCSPNGVRLKRNVPVNSTGTCTRGQHQQCCLLQRCGGQCTSVSIVSRTLWMLLPSETLRRQVTPFCMDGKKGLDS